MVTLKQYIKESFKIGRNKMADIYNYHPKTKDELKDILIEKLEKDDNAYLNDIDTSKITDMSGLFFGLDPHNIDISDWDVSNVTNMRYMFRNCSNFKGNGLENWDVSNVENMYYMFEYCKNFNADLSNWNISKNCNIIKMFSNIKNRQNIKLPNCLYDPNKNTHKSNGEELLWFKIWKTLDKNGPMTKAEVLTSLGLQPRSYPTSFAKWSSCNMIVGDKGKLKALPSNEWTEEIF